MRNEKANEIIEDGFAPQDPTDGRDPGEWKSRYCKEASNLIRLEAFVLLVFFFMSIFGSALISIHGQAITSYFGISNGTYYYSFAYAAFGGLFGGTLFSMKWLYHVVARGKWNLDRRLWRFMTPLISSGLSLVTIIFIKSGLFAAFDAESTTSGTLCFSLGFIVGYFSDSAIAKFAEVAQTLFGVPAKTPRSE